MQALQLGARSSRYRWKLVAAACALVVGMVWMGCSIEKNYKTLSFFFDGVPDPNAAVEAESSADKTAAMRLSATYTIHQPFAEDKCAECHTGQIATSSRNSSVCLKCHAQEKTKYPRMHGPVAVAACLLCHDPHESAHSHLLKERPRRLCMQCHDQLLLSTDVVPEHADDSRSCIDCHSGHGGTAPLFLKEGISRMSPTNGETAAPTK